MKHGCCVDKCCTSKSCMQLPSGRTCADCRHIKRCVSFGFTKPGNDHCDFYPRRFLPVAHPAPTGRDGGIEFHKPSGEGKAVEKAESDDPREGKWAGHQTAKSRPGDASASPTRGRPAPTAADVAWVVGCYATEDKT